VVTQISATGHERVAEFLAGLRDPTQASYHVQRSYEAIVNGGWFGVGIGRAQSKLTGLPVPPTDSIFAVVVEELGLVGATCLIGLYAVVIWRGLVIAILLNINLAIINLLPIPILDGGHIVFALAEAVHRRPLNARLVHATSLTFAALLISFMVYISVNNFEQWFLPDHAKLRATEPSNELPATGTQAPQP